VTLKRAMDPADQLSMTGARNLNDERGYTLVELLVAAIVLVVGMAGAFTLLNGANRASVTNNARMGANNLARELLEDARSVDYDQLTPSGIMPALQAKAGVTGSPTSWIVARRGIKFTVTTSVCTFDDPKDNIAATPPANVCTPQAPVPASATGLDPEAQPDDFRRVTVTVAWNTGNGNRSYKQVSLINNPSGGLGPRITQFDPPYTKAGGDPAQLTTDVTANFPTKTTTAGSVRWNSDGTPNGSGDSTGGPTTWGTNWALGAAPVGKDPLTANWSTTQYDPATTVLDGTYTVTAQAFDELGIAGDSRAAVLPVNRSRPITVTGFDVGVNFNFDPNIVEFQWRQNPELDIIGYRVYELGPDNTLGNGNDTLICSTSKAIDTSCTTSLPSDTPTYGVVALDLTDITDTGSVVRESQYTVKKTLSKTQPASPTLLLVTPDLSTLKPKLNWSHPDTGAVSFYRIYRTPSTVTTCCALGDRWAVTANGTTTSYVDSTALTGTYNYWVTAVGPGLNESTPVGPVVGVAP
jgi:prepilin-type N-terminal cleavage/methylation domain-containing protein